MNSQTYSFFSVPKFAAHFSMLVALSTGAYAQNVNWTGGAGASTPYWDLVTNWGGVFPAGIDNALIGPAYVPIFRQGTVSILSLQDQGAFFLSGGTLSVASNSFINGPLTISGGALAGTGTTTVGGASGWTGGQIGGNNGQATFNGPLAITGAADKTLYAGTLTTNGTTTWGGNTGNGNNRFLGGNGAIINNNGTWQDQNAFDALILANSGGVYQFNNAGTYTKSGAAVTSLSAVTLNNTTSGTIDVQAGRLQIASGTTNHGLINVESGASLNTVGGSTLLLNEGTLEGTGVIKGNVRDSGTLLPGSADFNGDLTIDGNYTQTSTGIFEEYLGATSSVLRITGNAIFDGDLQLFVLDGTSFDPFERFIIAEISGVLSSGYFGGQTRFTDNLGDIFTLSQVANGSYTDLVLTATDVASVPIPAAAWLFCSGLVGVAGLSRRRQAA
jgi:hypothetical protein